MKKKDIQWQNITVPVTGATGFVSPYLVRELLKKEALILEEARQNEVEKFVYISTSHVYEIFEYLPIVNTYFLNYGLKTTVIRPFNMYGAGQSEGFIIPSIIKQANEKYQCYWRLNGYH